MIKLLVTILFKLSAAIKFSFISLLNETKFLYSYTIKEYGEKWIKAVSYIHYPSYIWLNRNTGEMTQGSTKIPCCLPLYANTPVSLFKV